MTEEQRWRSHPVGALVLRVAIFAVPLVLSIVAASTVARLLPAPRGLGQTLLWWTGVLSVSTLVLIGGEAVARRLLPLVALLRLSLLFPGSAPSRFMVTRQSTRREMRRLVAEVKDRGLDDDPAVAARTIVTLVAAMNAHDRGTRGHSERVRALTDLLAEQLDLEEHDRDRLRWAALLHDIGKLLVPHHVLNKPGPLTPHEWDTIHAHPEAGDRLVAPMRAWLGDWGAVIKEHHERWDGAGYPAGLAREEISWGARIVAVADSYEVMTAVRSYQGRARSPGVAREELVRCAGAQFDPAVVRAFLNLSTRRLWLVLGPLSWLTQIPLVGSIPQVSTVPTAVAGPALAKVGAVLGAALLVGGGSADSGLLPARVDEELGGSTLARVELPTRSTEPMLDAARPVSAPAPAAWPDPELPIGDARPPSPRAVPARIVAPATATTEAPATAGPVDVVAPEAAPVARSDAPSRVVNHPAPTTGPPPWVPPTTTTTTTTTSAPPPPPPPPDPVAPPPDARSDSAIASPGEQIVVDVLANDGGSYEPGTLRIASAPKWGVASISSAQVLYQAHDQPRADHLSYAVCDADGRCDVGDVHVIVRPGG